MNELANNRVTFETIERIAQEESVPFPVLYGIWATESTYGTNADAFVDPTVRASRSSSQPNPDKWGKGSFQLTRPTYESLRNYGNSGVELSEFKNATDEELLRAGARAIKSKVGDKSDGNYEQSAVLRAYKGSGKDAAFGNIVTSAQPQAVASYLTGLKFAEQYEALKANPVDASTLADFVKYMPHLNAQTRKDTNALVRSNLAPGNQSLQAAGVLRASALPDAQAERVKVEADKERVEAEATRARDAVLSAGKEQNSAIQAIQNLFSQNPIGVGETLNANARAIRELQFKIADGENALRNTGIDTRLGLVDNINGIAKRLNAYFSFDRDNAKLKELIARQAELNNAVAGVINTSPVKENYDNKITAINVDSAIRQRTQDALNRKDVEDSKADARNARVQAQLDQLEFRKAAAQTNAERAEIQNELAKLRAVDLQRKQQEAADKQENANVRAAAFERAIKSVDPNSTFLLDKTKDIETQVNKQYAVFPEKLALIKARVQKPGVVDADLQVATDNARRTTGDDPVQRLAFQNIGNILRSADSRNAQIEKDARKSLGANYTFDASAGLARKAASVNIEINAPINAQSPMSHPLAIADYNPVLRMLLADNLVPANVKTYIENIYAARGDSRIGLLDLIKAGENNLAGAKSTAALFAEYDKRRAVIHGISKLPGVELQTRIKIRNGNSGEYDLTNANDILKLRAAETKATEQLRLLNSRNAGINPEFATN